MSLFGFQNRTEASQEKYPKGDGELRLYNFHLDEITEIQLRQNGELNPKGLAKANHALRSRDNSEVAPIDIRLLDLLDHLQDYFQVDTIEVISGFRRKKFNRMLHQTGHQVSPQSLHIRGKAIDFHIDEIKEETVRDYLLSLKLGGVGYYGPLDFIHVDTGSFRTWGGSESFARKLIGILNSDAPVQLTSDKNDYLPEDSLYFTWNFQKGFGPNDVKAIRLEHFWRGKWVKCPSQNLPEEKSILPVSSLLCPMKSQKHPFGKYRWIFKVKGEPGLLSSNEFYLKKK